MDDEVKESVKVSLNAFYSMLELREIDRTDGLLALLGEVIRSLEKEMLKPKAAGKVILFPGKQ
ncbi:MAG: hypothetical protein ACFFB3_11805 [Candidatus Hodarchaeota archaeon]